MFPHRTTTYRTRYRGAPKSKTVWRDEWNVADILDVRPAINWGVWRDALRCCHEGQTQGTAGAARAGRPRPASGCIR